MRKIVVFILLLFAIQKCWSNVFIEKEKNVEITYIANEGFLIKVGDKKVLIDALFGDKDYGFCDIPSNETMNMILKNEMCFKNIDIIAATHAHLDHLYGPFIIEHLLNNMAGKFVSCGQIIQYLKKQDKYDKVSDRLFEITPDNLTCIDTTINSIGVRVYRISHGPYYDSDSLTGKKVNRHQNIQNLGFLFNINGVKIFHSGDSSEDGIAEYEHFRLDKENIDIAFLGRGFIWELNCKGIELIKKYINPKHIVLMHIHHDEYNEFNAITTQLKNEFSDIKIFNTEMETKNYVLE